MKKPLVHFIVCTFNNKEIIADTVRAVSGQTVGNFSCSVIDNVSTDGTPEFIRQNFPFVDVVMKEKNTGPAASRNVGISRAKTPYIVFLDSDVELSPSWAEEQIAFLESGYDIASGKLVYASEPSVLNSAYGSINRFAVAWDGGDGHKAAEINSVRRCLWTTTAAMIVRREVVEEMGGFDEAMFAFHEDSDFGWRANLFGYRIAFNPRAVAVHRVHGTMSERTMGTMITYLVCRNRLRSAMMNYGAWNALLYGGAYIMLACMDITFRGRRLTKARALWWNLANFPDTWRRRRMVQRGRKVRDSDLWSLFEPGVRGPGYRCR